MIVSITFDDICQHAGANENCKAAKKATVKFLRNQLALVNTFKALLLIVANTYIEEMEAAAAKQIMENYDDRF